MRLKKSKQTKDEIKNQYYLKNYGITYAEFKEKAKNGCEVCGRKIGRLNLDHIHIRGYRQFSIPEKRKFVRGVCCFLCNTGFKGFEKTNDGNRNRRQLEGTIKYFQRWKLKGEIS